MMSFGPFEIWTHTINDTNLNLWVNNGDIHEILTGSFYAGSSKNICCDFTTLLTLKELNLLDFLTDKYNVYIYQNHLDLAFQEYSKNKLVNENGLKFLSYEHGKVKMTEYSLETVRESLKKQEELFNWINSNCIKVGKVISNRQNEEESAILNLQDLLKLCQTKELTLLIDSSFVTNYAKETYAVNCFSTIDLLTLLLANGEINQDSHSKLLGKLIIMGQILIPVGKGVFTYHIKKNNYVINQEVSLILNYLKLVYFSEEFIINTIFEILEWIWAEQVPDSNRRILTEHLCSLLCFNREQSNVIPKLIQHIKLNCKLNEDELINIQQYIEEWCSK